MMPCPECGKLNGAARIYCGGCATRLGSPCPVCQFVNGADDRFCGGCGREVVASVAEPAPAAAAIPVPAPEALRAGPAGFPAGVFDDLEDLLSGPASVAGGDTLLTAAADSTQDEIDGFFQRLVREGVAEIDAPKASARTPGRAQRELS